MEFIHPSQRPISLIKYISSLGLFDTSTTNGFMKRGIYARVENTDHPVSALGEGRGWGVGREFTKQK